MNDAPWGDVRCGRGTLDEIVPRTVAGVITVALLESGTARVAHRGGSLRLAVGDGVVTEDVGALRAPDAEWTIVTVATAALIHVGVSERLDTDPLVLRAAGTGPLRALIAALLRTGGGLSESARDYSGRAVLSLLGGCILASRSDARRRDDDLRARAGLLLDARFAEPSLRAETVAQALNVSLRTLQRAFSASGSTVSGEILVRRRDLAMLLLSNERYAEVSVTAIATLAGFSEPAELRRSLTLVSGLTPRAFRARAFAQARTVDRQSA